MQKHRLELSLKSIITFNTRSGTDESEEAERLIEDIENGYAPIWIEELIKRGILFDEIEVEHWKKGNDEPAPDEELNFDY